MIGDHFVLEFSKVNNFERRSIDVSYDSICHHRPALSISSQFIAAAAFVGLLEGGRWLVTYIWPQRFCINKRDKVGEVKSRKT